MTWNLASGLEGKRVILTGGAGGIGREVALAFGAAGARVAVIDLDEDKVRAVVAEMAGGPHLPLAADLRPVRRPRQAHRRGRQASSAASTFSSARRRSWSAATASIR